MTDNVYWIFLENLRKSGVVNMYGSAPYLQKAFGIKKDKARKIVAEWMENYNPKDYKEN